MLINVAGKAMKPLFDWRQLTVCAVIVVGVQMAIIIEKVPKSTKIIQGESALLECVARSSSNDNASYRCSWLKDDRVMFVGEGKRKQLYDWAGDYRSGNCSITLRNADVTKHQGFWRCDIINVNSDTNDNEMASTSPVMVTVLVPPTYPEIQDSAGNTLKEVSVVEGHRQELHCISRHGNPAAYLRWTLNTEDISMNATFYNNSEPFGPGGPSTNISNGNERFRMYTAGSWLAILVNRSYEGAVLQCSSRHSSFSNGYTQNTSVTLNVIYPPKNVTVDNNLTIAIDDALKLDCPLDGKPTPAYVWYWQKKNDQTGLQIGWEKELILNNFSDGLTDGGYFCTASSLVGSQNVTAYSGMYMLTSFTEDVMSEDVECVRDMTAFCIVLAVGVFAILSLGFEVILLAYFKCHPKKASSHSFVRNTIYELYFTRGRKMALVHVRGDHTDKGGKGYTLHISSPFISWIMVLLDLVTIAAFALSVIFCYSSSSCVCTFLNPAIICAIICGSIVIILQFVFLIGFCVRKKEDSKYRNYARKQEDMPGIVNDELTKSDKDDAEVMQRKVTEPNDNTVKQVEKKSDSEEQVPGSVPV